MTIRMIKPVAIATMKKRCILANAAPKHSFDARLWTASKRGIYFGGCRPPTIPVTCLMPGATETEFFRRAEMMDTAIGISEKDDPAEVANPGFDAMMKGESDVVSGLKNKVQSAAAVTPAGILASQHRKMAEPGSAKKS